MKRNNTEDEQRPIIFEYTDFRKFVNDMLQWQNRGRRKMTLESFANAAGIKSGQFVRWVIDGQRNLAEQSIVGFANALQLNSKEQKRFEELVRLSQSDSTAEQIKKLKKLAGKKGFQEAFHISPDQIDYFADWITPAVHMLVKIDGGFHIDEIQGILGPKTSKPEVNRSIDVLKNLGLVDISEDGNMTNTIANVTTPDEFTHQIVKAYHQAQAQLGLWAIENIASESRNFGAITALLNSDGQKKVFDKLRDQRNEMSEFVRQLERENGDRVVQINFQSFPVTNPIKNSSKSRNSNE